MLEVRLKPVTPGYMEKSARIKAGQEKTLGRSHRSDIIVAHPEISRQHCKIVNDGKRCTLLDLGSVNGVFVNGKRVANRDLVDGDIISICNIKIAVSIQGGESMTDSSVMLIDGEEESKVKKRMSYEPTRIMDDIYSPSSVENLKKAHANLTLIAKVANLIFDTSRVEEKFNQVIKTVVESFQADRGCILILNPVTTKIEPKAVFQVNATRDANVGISKTIVNESFQKGLSVLSANIVDDARFMESDSIINLNITSVMCVPLEGKDSIIGVIYIDTIGTKDVFTEESLKVLNTIGYQVGSAVQRAWLEQDLRNSTSQLEEYSRRLEAKVSERTSHLTRMIDRLKENDKLKSQFLANMSHELRTPLNAIVGFASLIQDRVYGEITVKQDDAITKIKQNAQNLLGMINNILDISRIDAGRMPLYLEDFDAGTEIQGIVAEFRSLIKKEVAVEFELDTALTAVYNDKGKYHQIVRNLFANAVKFTAEGSILLRTEMESETGMLVTTVKDSGIGISKEEIQYVFDEFRQVDGSKTRRYEGSGLGLAICQRLVKLMGGHIDVASKPEKGSEFIVFLPLDIRDVIEEGESFPSGEKKE